MSRIRLAVTIFVVDGTVVVAGVKIVWMVLIVMVDASEIHGIGRLYEG